MTTERVPRCVTVVSGLYDVLERALQAALADTPQAHVECQRSADLVTRAHTHIYRIIRPSNF